MIKINLLGDALAQVAKKGERAEPAQVYLEGEGGRKATLPVVGIVVGLLFSSLGGIHYLMLNREQERLVQKQAELAEKLRELEPYIKKQADYEKEKAELEKREKVMLNLKRSQQLPVHFFEELANSLPEDIWFVELSWKGAAVTIRGEARTFEAANRFYDALKDRPRWFKNVNYPGGTRDPKGKVTFSMSFELQNPA